MKAKVLVRLVRRDRVSQMPPKEGIVHLTPPNPLQKNISPITEEGAISIPQKQQKQFETSQMSRFFDHFIRR